MREILCRCGGAIRNAEAWKLGRWCWQWLAGAFLDGITSSDLDFIVERGGNFLVYECKGLNAEIRRGQLLMLQRLAKLPQFTVIILEGDLDEPVWWQQMPNGPRLPANRNLVHEYTAMWMCNQSPKARRS